jgi:hypothetical protein
VFAKPGDEIFAAAGTCGEFEHQPLLLIGARDNIYAVEQEKRGHGGMADAFVTVEKRMVLDE